MSEEKIPTNDEIWQEFFVEFFKIPYNKYANQAINSVGGTALVKKARAAGFREGLEGAAEKIEQYGVGIIADAVRSLRDDR